MSITHMLKGVTGEFEINRVVGALGSISYVATANAMVVYEVVFRQQSFDLIAYCAAFPAGLGVAIGAIAGAVALKDRQVTKASVESAQGLAPPVGAQP